ncbi:MAG: SMP-30/gluconolactonase/LRE family protein [Glycocaulis sp.]
MMILALALAASLALSDTPAAAPGSLLDQSLALRAETRTLAAERDWEGAARANAAALALQPGHQGLLTNAVALAANGGDFDAALDALDALAGAGFSLDLASARGLEAALEEHAPSRLAVLRERMAQNIAPVGRAERYLSTPLPDALVESFAVDIDAERLYLGTVADASLYSVRLDDPGNPERLAGPEDGMGSVFGLALDGRNRILYAATGRIALTPDGAPGERETALVAFDLLTGEVSARHMFAGAGRFSDVVVQDGIVYASDSVAGQIYRLNRPGGELELYAGDSRFASLQGLALSRGALFVADYATGLWRIDPVSREASRVEVTQGSLIGFDGLATDSYGEIYGIRNGSQPHGLFHIALQGFGDRARVTPVLTGHRDFGDPVTVRISDGRFFILANAQWDLFPEEGSQPAEPRRDPVILFMPVP